MNAKENFETRADVLREDLAKKGYTRVNKPVNLSRYVDAELISDCEIIARKTFFNIVYLEAHSNWKRVSAGVARTQNGPCIVFTRYDDSRMIVTTLTDRLLITPKPRYLVISGSSMFKKFFNKIKVTSNDTVETIDSKIMNAFGELSAYNEALKEFGTNLDDIINETTELIETRIKNTPGYAVQAKAMLEMCHDVVSDKMNITDIKDMLIQHVITYKIFELVYDDTGFHTTNVVAKLLERLKTFLKIPDNVVDYKTLELIAESLTETDDKQEFLQNLYAIFYKKYDPEKSSKDGIVYTPKQAVAFMIRSVDILLKRHFKKTISDDNIHILDPATGTGTFMVGILRAITPTKLSSKYVDELHANEIYILPYYIAALNIEQVYYELSGTKANFPGICWTDTLDIKQGIDEFIDDDNAKRISRQRKQPIFVVIGNPPYSVAKNSVAAWYPNLHESIQNDWRSGDKQVKVNLDLYKVFLKWSTERIKKRGMVAFISNSSFINSAGDFKMRESICKEFDHIYVVNLKGYAHLSGDSRRRERGNVFGNQARVGVCITFFIKTGERKNKNNLQYAEIPDYLDRDSKLDWLNTNTIDTIKTSKIIPEKPKWDMCPPAPKTNWSSLVPLLPEDTAVSIFAKHLLGVQSNKDQWVYNITTLGLEERIKYYMNKYNACLLTNTFDNAIKWTREIKKHFKKNTRMVYSKSNIEVSMYRPFVKRYQYTDSIIIDWYRQTQLNDSGMTILFPNHTPKAEFGTFITNAVFNSACVGETRGISLHVNNVDFSITKWGLDLFKNYYHYDSISPKDVFHYTYAILNDPKYLRQYEHDLRTSFPRIPLVKDVADFIEYKKFGAKLASIHLSYEKAKPYPLRRVTLAKPHKKPKLVIEGSKIVIDDTTVLEGLPVEATQYMVGTKSALRWILEYYTEQKNFFKVGNCRLCDTGDQTVADRFNTYSFAEHKENAIDLIRRVTSVAVETMHIKEKIKSLEWGPQPVLEFTPQPKKGNRSKSLPSHRSLLQKNKKIGVTNEKKQARL